MREEVTQTTTSLEDTTTLTMVVIAITTMEVIGTCIREEATTTTTSHRNSIATAGTMEVEVATVRTATLPHPRRTSVRWSDLNARRWGTMP